MEYKAVYGVAQKLSAEVALIRIVRGAEKHN